MTERGVRPILMIGPMVRAILREIREPGAGKIQTRRILKWQPGVDDRPFQMENGSWHVTDSRGCNMSPIDVRFVVGDILWVRETWQWAPQRYCTCPQPSEPSPCDDWSNGTGCRSNRAGVVYRADGERLGPWRPSIFMPREVSRLTLEVTAVRVSRLQSISELDAMGEGAEPILGGSRPHVEGFRAIWDGIHGAGAWDLNPWVAAITFRPHNSNVDSVYKEPRYG